jgi:aspartyl protease family protein
MFGLDSDDTMQLVFLGLLLVFVASGLGLRSGGLAPGLRNLAIWATITIALVAVYAYRTPLQRLAAPVLHELAPSRVLEITDADGGRELVVARGQDGHFHVEAEVNGEAVRFLVDTGASGTVLTLRDAERSGIDTADLSFDRPVQTANGRAFYARARANTVEIGPFRLSDVPIAVMAAEALSTSLLGMDTINRFSAWRVEGDRMVLVP